MKRFAAYILPILSALLFLSSCTEKLGDNGGQKISITISSSEVETRATQPGDDQYRENLITSVHWFAYPDGGTGSNAVLSGVESGLSSLKSHDLGIDVNDAIVNSVLFPRAGSGYCTVYVIVNLPSGATIPSNTSIESLKKNIALSADFDTYKKNGAQAFVMDGEAQVKIASRTANIVASGSVPVYRVASKYTVSVAATEYAEDASGDKWYPQPGQMWIKFYNCVSDAALSGQFSDNPDPTYFSYPANPRSDLGARTFVSNGKGRYLCEPFYTYPMEWEYNTDEEPYMVIMLPWKRESDLSPKAYYYKVLLSDRSAVRNTWYHLEINLAVLGSLTEENPPVTQTLEYHVADWSNEIYNIGNSVDAVFKAMRYLVVPDTEFVLDNENTLDIEYFSSHDCEIASVTCSRPNLKTWQGSIDNLDSTAPSWFSLVVEDETTYIRFDHTLNNEQDDNTYDYTGYTITLRIRHKDMPATYYEDITIVQYPSLVVTAELNSDLVSGKTGSACLPHIGYVIVNGSQNASTSSVPNYGGVSHYLDNFPADGSNMNPNMYVIRTTALPKGSEYILADPRLQEVDLINGGVWNFDKGNWDDSGTNTVIASGVAIENPSTTRKLIYYHPTDTTRAAENKISPKFRIASSVGKTGVLSYTEAQRRCASYQEDGYPAGRWRIPTRAEAEYMIHLSVDGKIPSLFVSETKSDPEKWSGNSSYYYWCANGLILPWTDGTTGFLHMSKSGEPTFSHHRHAVRCVYDEWYWEQTDYPVAADKTKFTWGDTMEIL